MLHRVDSNGFLITPFNWHILAALSSFLLLGDEKISFEEWYRFLMMMPLDSSANPLENAKRLFDVWKGMGSPYYNSCSFLIRHIR